MKESDAEWSHAGTYLPGSERATMRAGESIATKLWFGCDDTRLYLRLDLVESPPSTPFFVLLTVSFPTRPEPVLARTALLRQPGRHSFTILPASGKRLRRSTLVTGPSVKWGLALSDLGIPPGARFTIHLQLFSEGIERARFPERSDIPLCA